MTNPADSPLATSLAADPFTSLAVHYGMLLGVSDFDVIAANPRGKLRLHQAWQHGKGVVWGYGVSVPPDSSELRVEAGLAVDGLGREVAVGAPFCIDVDQWLDEQVEAGTAHPVIREGRRICNAQVVLRFRACLSRPVPALGGACQGGVSGDVAYSRVLETGELELRPYDNDDDGHPDPPDDTRGQEFALLRKLVRDGVIPNDLPPGSRGWLAAFRAVAARVSSTLRPPGFEPGQPDRTRLFPEDEPGELLLADLPGLEVVSTPDGPRVNAPVIDLSVRRTHLPTWVIEELLAELLAGHARPRPPADAGGPRVTRVDLSGRHVTVELTGDLVVGTVEDALELRGFDASDQHPAWSDPLPVAGLTVTGERPGPPPAPARFELDLPGVPTAEISYRLVLRGTGPTPAVGLVDGRPVPLAGRVRDPAGTRGEGHDVIEIFESGERP
jgi:hypothetical protein